MHPDWARSARDQCAAARHGASATGVPFFFKQWGEWAPYEPLKELVGGYPDNVRHALDGEVVRVGKKAAGRRLDGREHSEFPKVESQELKVESTVVA